MEIAKRSRGTPRIAVRLTRRVRDFALVTEKKDTIDIEVADAALKRMDVDQEGLDSMDRRYMQCIIDNYGGGPVGIDTMSAALSEQRDVLEEVIEPFLLQQGFVQRTPRGRVIADKGYRHLGLSAPKSRDQDILDAIKAAEELDL